MTAASEMWRGVGFHPDYEVSNMGRVRNAATGHILKLQTQPSGHKHVALSRAFPNRLVHILVARAFIGDCPVDKSEVAHGDGDPSNNCVNNLRWATHKENHQDRIMHGTSNRGSNNPAAKLTEGEVLEIKTALRAGLETQRSIAERHNVNPAHVSAINCGSKWAWLE